MALRATFTQLMGLLDMAPKHAHGGRRPCDRRTTNNVVKATNKTNAMVATGRRAI